MPAAQMIHYMWRVCLLKRGTHVLVNVNYSNAPGVPERWASGTLAGVSQGGRLVRVVFDDTRNHRKAPDHLCNHRFAGTTNWVVAFRVKRAITR